MSIIAPLPPSCDFHIPFHLTIDNPILKSLYQPARVCRVLVLDPPCLLVLGRDPWRNLGGSSALAPSQSAIATPTITLTLTSVSGETTPTTAARRSTINYCAFIPVRGVLRDIRSRILASYSNLLASRLVTAAATRVSDRRLRCSAQSPRASFTQPTPSVCFRPPTKPPTDLRFEEETEPTCGRQSASRMAHSELSKIIGILGPAIIPFHMPTQTFEQCAPKVTLLFRHCHSTWLRTVFSDGSVDSWVEISSQPSSSSLSSACNDIITTGLQIHPPEERLSRQFRDATGLSTSQPRSTSAAGSSQDEYEESESESDRVLSSSNEDIYQQENGDDDDTSTAIGVGSVGRMFTPQPNAFSHPPSSQDRPVSDSYFPPAPSSTPLLTAEERTMTQRSYERRAHSKHRTGKSSYQADHDAALRASLTTLLSCAAAVRPKGPEIRASASKPSALRLIPESELDGTAPARVSPSPKQAKRKSRESSKERHAKKARAAKAPVINDELISPTLASWMISAGVVLVFSAISFSAGYAWGREIGKLEADMSMTSGGCGRESLRVSGSGLRRLRWASATSRIST